ncbi:MAG: LysR family transcriptional regulator [Pseudomonadota bacterium]
MNLRALKVFAGIMDDGTLTEAAARLNLSQSAASRLLSLLETAVGAPLFLREKRQLIPTEAAEALYPEALRILAQISALPEVAAGVANASVLRVICHSRLAGGLVVPAIRRFAETMPGPSVRLETAPRRELARRVMAGRYDFAVAALPLSLGDRVALPLANPRLGIVLPRSHPLAGARSLSLQDLGRTPYIALDETTAVRRTIDAELGVSGPAPAPRIEVSTGTNAYRLVAAGLGFTFADPIALDPELRGELALVPWSRNVALAIGYFRLNEDRSAALDRFEELLRESAETAGQDLA